jgi:hypothetical protein
MTHNTSLALWVNKRLKVAGTTTTHNKRNVYVNKRKQMQGHKIQKNYERPIKMSQHKTTKRKTQKVTQTHSRNTLWDMLSLILLEMQGFQTLTCACFNQELTM